MAINFHSATGAIDCKLLDYKIILAKFNPEQLHGQREGINPFILIPYNKDEGELDLKHVNQEKLPTSDFHLLSCFTIIPNISLECEILYTNRSSIFKANQVRRVFTKTRILKIDNSIFILRVSIVLSELLESSVKRCDVIVISVTSIAKPAKFRNYWTSRAGGE